MYARILCGIFETPQVTILLLKWGSLNRIVKSGCEDSVPYNKDRPNSAAAVTKIADLFRVSEKPLVSFVHTDTLSFQNQFVNTTQKLFLSAKP